jgi:aspartyl-tRNA(Asn)/glutamyl-tRNA(Gln) amidotransferase subunit A
MKPTYGAVSRFGLIAMASSLDQIGPLARDIADAELAFDAVRGADPFDATSVAHDPVVVDTAAARTLVIGYPREYFESIPDPAVREGLARARALLEAEGFSFREISLPHLRHALAVYYIVMPAEVSTNLARFDGVRYHGIPEVAVSSRTIHELFERTRATGFGPEPRRRMLLGTFVLSSGHYDSYYAHATMVRELIRRDFEQAFETVDIVFAPVTPTVPFNFGEKKNDPLAMYLADVFTTHANLTGLPALSVPVERYMPGSGVPPVGFQLIARRFRDHELLRIGAMYESRLAA